MSEYNNLLTEVNKRKAWNEIAKAGVAKTTLLETFRYAKVKGNVFVFVFRIDESFAFRYATNIIREKIKAYLGANKHLLDYLPKNKGLQLELHSMYLQEEQFEVKQEAIKVPDKSRGTFENRCKNEKLHRKIEQIREMIKAKQ